MSQSQIEEEKTTLETSMEHLQQKLTQYLQNYTESKDSSLEQSQAAPKAQIITEIANDFRQIRTKFKLFIQQYHRREAETTLKVTKYQQSLQSLAKELWREKGDQQLEQADCSKMIEFAQRIIKNSPNADYGGVGIGNLQEKVGVFEADPVKWYLKARKDQSLPSSPYDLLGLAYLTNERYEDGEKWFSSRIAKSHNNYQLLLGLANIEYNLGKYTEAEQLYQRVVGLKPNLDRPYQQMGFIAWLKKDKIQDARKLAQQALQKNKENIYAQYILGMTEEGDAVLQSLHKIIEKNKNYARVCNGLGKVYKQKNSFEEAVKFYKKAIQMNPKYQAPYYGLGVISYTKGNFDEAIRLFEQCLSVNPKYESPLCGLGSAYHRKNNHEQSIKWYSKCLQVNPKHFQALSGMGTVQALIKNYEQSMKMFERCLQIKPSHSLSLNSLGNVYFQKKIYEKAIECYKKCIEIDPKYGAPYNGLSHVYTKLNNEEEAQKWLTQKDAALKK